MTHWEKQAKLWTLIDAPLKPSLIDIQNSSAWIHDLAVETEAFHVLVLGVTPELIKIVWPKQTTLISIDYNLAMIESVLPTQNCRIKPLAITGNWLQIPLADACIDLVIGDGCYTLLAVKDYARVNEEVRRILKPKGSFIMRFFSRPEKNESLETIHEAIASQTIGNFHALKFRIAMSLHESLSAGVCLKNVWEYWNEYFKNKVSQYKQQLNWTDEVIRTIDNYKYADVYYTFPTLTEIGSLFAADFDQEILFNPDYNLGLSCPTLKMKPKALS